MEPFVRPYLEEDHDAVYDVCVRTGAASSDARGLYRTDDLVPDIYAGAYLLIEPELAFVLDNGDRAVGYILGTADSRRFVRAYRDRWIPRMRERYAEPSPQAEPVTEEDRKLAVMFNPESMLRPELAPYPAHLHINLLPGYQRRGFGRVLMAEFLAAAARHGAPAAYLAVYPSNTGARAFYASLGWREVRSSEPGRFTYLAKATA
jgi:ribosomal protein S18 acetylase RimI-like enzyme